MSMLYLALQKTLLMSFLNGISRGEQLEIIYFFSMNDNLVIIFLNFHNNYEIFAQKRGGKFRATPVINFSV